MSYEHGLKFYTETDDLIYWYRFVPNLRLLAGVDENKTRFYYSRWGFGKKVADANLKALGKRCNYNKEDFDKYKEEFELS